MEKSLTIAKPEQRLALIAKNIHCLALTTKAIGTLPTIYIVKVQGNLCSWS